jgi:hypothetical protein
MKDLKRLKVAHMLLRCQSSCAISDSQGLETLTMHLKGWALREWEPC